MALLTVTINDPGFDKKSAEVSFIERALQLVVTEVGAARGNRTNGMITGNIIKAGSPQTLGSWTYTASATNA